MVLGLAGPELIVKYLQRNGARISGRHHRAREPDHVKVAFAGHIAKVTRPIEHVHFNSWRIRKMDEENFIAGNAADCVGIDLAGQSVKAVENKPDIVMVGAPDDVPSVPVIVDMTAPGQRLVAHAQRPLFRAVSELVKVCRGALGAANRLWDGRRSKSA